MGHVTGLTGRVFLRSGTEFGSESRAVSMGPRLSGNDVIAEMTSAEMTTETGSEVKKYILFTAAILDVKSSYKVSYFVHK